MLSKIKTLFLNCLCISLAVFAVYSCGSKTVKSLSNRKSSNSSKHFTSDSILVLGCNDGDTCNIVVNDEDVIRVRLSGVDTPESGNPFSEAARRFTNDLIKGKSKSEKLKLKCVGSGGFDRTACFIEVDGQDLGELLVKNGLAWDSPKYSKRKYAKLQIEAMKNQIGVWSLQLDRLRSPYCQRHANAACESDPLTMP